MQTMKALVCSWLVVGVSLGTALSAGGVDSGGCGLGRIVRFGPHRAETFKLSPGPWLIDKVRDIVGLYVNPPEHAVVFCVDEKPQLQAIERTAPLLRMQPGQAERHTFDYRRHGTISLFAALDVKTGTVIGEWHRRHRSVEFENFLKRIDRAVVVQDKADVQLGRRLGTSRPGFGAGWPNTRASICISLRPTVPG